MTDTRLLELPEEVSIDEGLQSPNRRKLMAYAISAPVMTIVAGFGANFAIPSTAHALPLALTPPDSVDYTTSAIRSFRLHCRRCRW